MIERIGLKARLNGDDPLYGFFVGLPSPALVEMIGFAGFDFVIVDAEHGPATGETLENMLRAAELAGVAAIVRVASDAASEILRALDAGAAGILVPHVTSAEIARGIVEKAHFPPHGKRGISSLTRAAGYGFSVDYIATRHATTVVIVMIEDREALPHVGEIAAVDGADALFIGPTDLAGSMGLPGQANHPDVAAAIERIMVDVRAVSTIPIATTGRIAGDADRLRTNGFKMICFNATHMLAESLRSLRANLPPQVEDGTTMPFLRNR